MDKIAILLATYNGEDYIADQLNSLLRQTVQNFVCYIHDDGSTDKTVQIIENFEKRYSDKIRILRYGKTGGARNNFMSMLSKVDAEYYMFCDQDDVWLPEKIEKTYIKMQSIEANEKPCVVFSDLCVVAQNLSVLNSSYMKYTHRNPYKRTTKELLVQNVAAGCTMMINRTLREVACRYTDVENIFMHDWWCILVSSVVGTIEYIDDALILYRQHDKNQVGAKDAKLAWLKSKISNVLKGKQVSASKQGILMQRQIAGELSKVHGLDKCEKDFLTQLSEIENKNKFYRIIFYARNKLIRSDIKNIWKILIV